MGEILITTGGEKGVAISYSTRYRTLTVETASKRNILKFDDLKKPEVSLLEKLVTAGVDMIIKYKHFTASEIKAVADLRVKLPDPLGISCNPNKGYYLSV